MSLARSTPTTALGKRKRPTVSYAEKDVLDFLSDGEEDTTVQLDQSSDDESDKDDRTYSTRKKKAPKKKSSLKKRKTKSSREARDSRPFPFMDLPPELRDVIYEMVLTDPNGVTLVSKTKACRRTVRRGRVYDHDDGSYWYGRRRVSNIDAQESAPKNTTMVPNLLAVNKQVRDEAINYLYNQDLIFEDTLALHRFLATIGLRNQKRLLNIELKAFATGRRTMPVNYCAFALLGNATNLKSVKISRHHSGWYRSPANHAQGLYRDAHFFMEAFGDANGRKDAAVDIFDIAEDNFDAYHFSVYSRRNRSSERKDLSPAGNEEVFRNELRRLLGVK